MAILDLNHVESGMDAYNVGQFGLKYPIRTATVSGAVKSPGDFVVAGAGKTCATPSAVTERGLGFVVNEKEHGVNAVSGDAVTSYAVGDEAPILTEGNIAINAAVAVAENDPVYIETSGANAGKAVNASSATTLGPYGYFEETAALGALVMITFKV